jgi:hypothetical protein
VRHFVDAYNKRDFAAVEAALSADARWYAVDGEKIAVEGDGRAALVAWTRRYLLQTCTTCRSELVSVAAEGNFVTTIERARWVNKSGACVSQAGAAVYQLGGSRIQAVWYFPASPQVAC